MSRALGRPLFIVGAPRSGTSLVYRLLALHPGASWVNNYLRRAPAVPALSALNRVAGLTPETRGRVWFGSQGDNAYRYNGARSALDRLYPQPVEGEPVFAHRDVPDHWESGTVTPRQRRLPGDLERITRWSGGDVFVSKRIGHSRRIPLLHELVPTARYLDVTRDGRAVAYSLLRVDWWPEMDVWWYGGRPADWAAEGKAPLELCARHWLAETEVIDQGLSVVSPDQVMRIRYEDLVADPHAVLSDVASFSGLDPDDGSWRKALQTVRFPNQNAAWSKRLDDSERETLRVLDGPLRELGYAV